MARKTGAVKKVADKKAEFVDSTDLRPPQTGFSVEPADPPEEEVIIMKPEPISIEFPDQANRTEAKMSVVAMVLRLKKSRNLSDTDISEINRAILDL